MDVKVRKTKKALIQHEYTVGLRMDIFKPLIFCLQIGIISMGIENGQFALETNLTYTPGAGM